MAVLICHCYLRFHWKKTLVTRLRSNAHCRLNRYVFTRECLCTRRHRIGTRPIMHVMTPLESTDIDTEHDFKMAEVLAEIAS